MAKKKETKVNSGDLTFDSNLDFNFDGGFEINDVGKKNKKRKPIDDVVKGTLSGAKAQVKSASFWNSIAKKALPNTYSVITDELSKTRDVLSESYRDSAKALRPELSRIGRQVDSLVPEEAKRLKKLTARFGGKKDSEGLDAASAESIQNQSITQAQHEIFNRLENTSISREARDRSEQRVRDGVESKRFQAHANILGNIAENMAKTAAYTTTVNSAFQKKSLELQYRSYYAQAELLKTTTRYNELFKAYFEAIKHNTSLPDFVKTKASEHFHELARAKLFSGVQSGLSAGVKRITGRVKEYVGAAAQGLGNVSLGLDALGSLQDSRKLAKELGIDESLLYSGASLAGGGLADHIGGKIGDFLSKRIKPGGKISSGLAKTARFVQNPTAAINKLQGNKRFTEFRQKDGLLGGFANLINFVLNDLKTPDEDTKLTDHQGPAGKLEAHPFTNRAHAALTEIIPGFLARILQEQTAIRMRTKVLGDLPTYDWHKGKFTSSKRLQRDIGKKILNKSEVEAFDYKLGQVSKAYTNKDLQGDQAKRVKDFAYKLAGYQRLDINSDDVYRTREFESLPKEDQELIRTQLTEYRKTEEGKQFISSIHENTRQGRSNQTAEAKSLIHELIGTGYAQHLIKLKLISRNKSGGYSINLKHYSKLIIDKGITSKGDKPEEKVDKLKEFLSGKKQQTKTEELFGKDESMEKPSDRNVKVNIRPTKRKTVMDRLKNIKTYTYNYAKKVGNYGRRQGYMAQDVKKEFGERVAPGGVRIDYDEMASSNTEAIKELHEHQQKQLKDPTAVDLLKSIDMRIEKLGAIGLYGLGIPIGPQFKRLFGRFYDYTKSIVGLTKNVAKTGINAGIATAKVGGDILKGTFDKNKDKVASGIKSLITDVISLTGMGFNTARGIISKGIPSVFNFAKGITDNVKEKVSDFLNKPRDFYIPGFDKPILIGHMFDKGAYFTKDGKPILTIEDLKKAKDGVYDKTHEIIVEASQLAKGLVDKHGNKLKSIATNLKGLAIGAVGALTSKLLHGASGFLNLAQGGLGGLKDLIGKGKDGLKGFLGGFTRKSDKILEQILMLLKKWDRHGSSGSTSSGAGDSSGATMAGTPSGAATAGTDDHPRAAQAGGGFGVIGGLFSGAKNYVSSGGLQRTLTKVKDFGARFKTTAAGQRLGNTGAAIGRFGGIGKKLSFLKGKAGGLLAGGLGLLKGNQAPTEGTEEHHEEGHPDAPQQKPSTGLGIGKFFSKALKSLSKIPVGQRAYNDPEGTGRRSGDFRTREEKLAEDDAEKKAKLDSIQNEKPDLNKYRSADKGAFNLLKGFTDFLQNKLGGVMNIAESAFSLFGSFGKKGIIGKTIGALGRGVGGVFRGIGSSLGLARTIGTPIASTIARVGATSVGRFLAGAAARTALISGAASIATGGTLGIALGAVSAGITVLGAVLTSPVTLGALAIAGAGYAAYKIYKHLTRNNLDTYQKFRYMQYGFGTKDTENYNHKLANLENYLLKGHVTLSSGSGKGGRTVILSNSNLNPDDILNIFEVDTKNEGDVKTFTHWFQGRFKPFFLNTLTALYNASQKLGLFTIDKLMPEQKLSFLKATKFDDGPYDFLDSPTKEIQSLSNNKQEVFNAIEVLLNSTEEQRKADVKKAFDDANSDKAKLAKSQQEKAAALKMAKQSLASDDKERSKKDEAMAKTLDKISDQNAKSSPATNPGKTISADQEQGNYGKANQGKPADGSNNTNSSIGSNKLITAVGEYLDGNAAMKYLKLKNSNVNIEGLNGSVLKNFLGMVQEYGESTGNSVTVNSAFRTYAEQAAEFKANPGKAAQPGKSLHNYGLALDIPSAIADSLEKLGLMRKYGFTRPVGGEPWHIEPAGIQGKLQAAKSDSGLASQLADASLGKGGGGQALISSAIKGSRNAELQASLLGANAEVAGQVPKQQSNQTLAAIGPVTAPVVPKSFDNVDISPKAPTLAQVTSNVSSPSPNNKSSLTNNDRYSIDLTANSPDTEKAPGTNNAGAGDKEPMFAMDKDGVLKAIDTYSKTVGVPSKDLQVIAAVESGLRPNAAAGNTSAKGTFQYTNASWKEGLSKYGQRYGLSGDETPQNLKASTIVAGAQYKDNLQRVKQVNPNAGLVEAYLAHFLGAAGARTFMTSDPSADSATVFPTASFHNRNIFFDGNKSRTIGEVYTVIANKLETAAKSFGINGVTINKTFPKISSTATPFKPNSDGGNDSSSTGGGSVSSVRAIQVATATASDANLNTQIPNQRVPRTLSAVEPTSVASSRNSSDSTDSPVKEMLNVANKSMDIQKKQLDTMVEIRDMIKTLMDSKAGANTGNDSNSSAVPSAKPKGEPLTPMLNIGRTRQLSA